MAISWTLATIRFVLMVANLFCLLCGVSLVVVGFLMRYQFLTFNGLFEEDKILQTESVVALVLGTVIFTVAFFGFFGSAKNSQAMISMYAFLVSVLMVVQSALAIMLFLGFDESRRYAFRQYGEQFDAGVKRSLRTRLVDPKIEQIQRDFRCCGKVSYREWADRLPRSCCLQGHGTTACFPFEQGCLEMLEITFDRSAKAVGWMLMVFSVVEFVAVISACYLASGIKEEKNKRLHRMY